MTYAPCLGDDLVDAFQVLWMISWLGFLGCSLIYLVSVLSKSLMVYFLMY
jgi:hypothetical protein